MPNNQEFDYVVVGGGSAGCAIANRLSANGKNTVCLVEAGPKDNNPFIHLPTGVIALVRGWFCNWKFWSEPQKHLENRRLYQPRGKVLGGSSAINASVNIRGHRYDYDHWAKLGNKGWSYEEVLPYFKKSENFEPYDNTPDAEIYHGKGGPLNIAERKSNNILSQAFVDAAVQAGHKPNNDFNGKEQGGVGSYHVYQKNGLRCSNAKAYLDPAKKRKNLKIMTDCHVSKIIIESKTAKGIHYRKGNVEGTVLARKEVIVSAGTFQSPQLLMLSGIGPEVELKKHNIPIHQKLQGVGKNLQDHLDVYIETRTNTRFSISLHPLAWPRLLANLVLFIVARKGMFTSNVAESGGFFKTSTQEPIPDIQWHLTIAMNAKHGLDLSRIAKYFGYSVMNYDLRPLSRGYVGLRSSDPFAPPLIDPNLGSEQRDIDKLVEAVKQTRIVLSQPALQRHNLEETSPGKHIETDEQIEAWVRKTAEVAYHPVGTCKMGPNTDPMAVVDERLNVHGIRRLRIADCSIMPTIVGGNTNQPATMIGEKAADMILQDNP